MPTNSSSGNRLLILGCGYLGQHVGHLASQAGWHVSATSRSRLGPIRKMGLEPLKVDWNDTRDLAVLDQSIRKREINRVLISVSYDRRSSVDRFVSQVDRLADVLKIIGTQVASPDVVYISTTGVYHQTDGAWVDENSVTRPRRAGGQAHLQAEAKFNAVLGEKSPWTILRLSGIYGPGRVPRAADVRAGTPIASPSKGYLNLIHVSDAARAVLAAMAMRPECRKRKYLISDDEPVVRQGFYEEIACQTNSPAPRFIDPAADSSVRFRSESNKRIWNRRMKRDLLPKLVYPTFREGLRDVLSAK